MHAPRTRPLAYRSLGCIALELALGMAWFSNVWLVPYLEFSAYCRKPQRTSTNGSWVGVIGGSDGSYADETALRAFERGIQSNLAAAYSALERPPSGAKGSPAAENAAQGAPQTSSHHAAFNALDAATFSDAITSPDNVVGAQVTRLAVASGASKEATVAASALAASASVTTQRRSSAFARFLCAALVVDFSARENVTDLAVHEWLSKPQDAATVAAAAAAEVMG